MSRLFIVVFLSQLTYGQTIPKVNSLFFNLPLDSSRSVIQNRLKSDNNFQEISNVEDTSDFTGKVFNTYLGQTSEKGFLKSQPDSVEVELTFGFGDFEKRSK